MGQVRLEPQLGEEADGAGMEGWTAGGGAWGGAWWGGAAVRRARTRFPHSPPGLRAAQQADGPGRHWVKLRLPQGVRPFGPGPVRAGSLG